MPLNFITFDQVLLNNNQIYITSYAKSISLITASAATHLPTSIFNYLDKNFFSYLCVSPGTEYNKRSSTSVAVPLKNCQCDGFNYEGMPAIDFLLGVDQYETKYSYRMNPIDFEMIPKVDT